MPRGAITFFLRRQKKVTKEKATPTFALIRDLKRKRRAVRNSLRSNNGPLHRRFRSISRGRIHGAPSKQTTWLTTEQIVVGASDHLRFLSVVMDSYKACHIENSVAFAKHMEARDHDLSAPLDSFNLPR